MSTSSSAGWVLVAVAVAPLALAGCSHNAEAPATPAEHGGAAMEQEILAVDAAEPEPPPVAARPRLSRTITLGEVQYEPLPDAPPPGPSGGGTSVVVNNYVMTPPPYGAYYGGYSYGSYGYGYGSGVGVGYAPRANVNHAPAAGRWGATGWEGAARTAAPGHTPAVGGNWAPPPSAGPRQLK